MVYRSQPRVVFFELTEGCNLKCIHCRATAQPQRSKDELSTKEVFEVIDQIATFDHPILILTGGEPLYRPDFFEIAKYASSKPITVAMASNGTLITKEVAKKIKESGIHRVAISFDGPNSSIHDQFRGLPGSFEMALNGARNVKEQGIEVQFNTTITRHNVNEIEAMIELGKREKINALHLFMLVPVGCGAQITDTNMLSSDEYEEVLTWFYNRSKEVDFEIRATCAPHYYRIMRQIAKDRKERIVARTHGMAAMTKGCLAGTGVLFVSHKGKIQPCGYLPVEAGDVMKQSLTDIWNDSPVFNRLRDQSALEGKCGYCEYTNVCGGCRARAYYGTEDYMASEPYCSYQPTI